MSNILRVAAAGAGKTYTICREAEAEIESLDSDGNHHSRVLMLSFATKAVQSLDEELRKGNDGVIPTRIDVMTWYSFLIQEMIKPYQSELYEINELKGLDFDPHPAEFNYYEAGDKQRYANDDRNIRSNQASELAILLNDRSQKAVIKRLEQIYTHIFIDEFQDMCGYDLDIIEALMRSTIAITVVGDGKQAVFKTNYASKNKGKGGKDIWTYFLNLKKMGLASFDKQNVSRRFNSEICNFANRVYSSENNIKTCMKVKTGHDGVFLILHEDVPKYVNQFQPVVLRWSVKTNTDGYVAINFGACKGETFNRVLIFPNGPLKSFLLKGKKLKSPVNYYVAVTRPKYSIAFVIDKLPKKWNSDLYEKTEISVGDEKISGWHLMPDPKFD